MKNICLLFSALCIASTALAGNAPNSNAATCPLPYKAVTTRAQALDVAQRAIEAYQLSSLRQECMQFMVEDPSKTTSSFSIDVYEKHNALCGGDPDTAPRIVSLQIQHGGQVLSYTTEGLFAAPSCPLSKTPNKVK